MTKDERMRVLTATTIIILIITGVFSLGMALVANRRHEADINGTQAVATITDLSVKKGEKITTVQYFSNDDAWTAELGEGDLRGKYELWDSIYVYYHKDDASKLMTQYSLFRLEHMITALIIIAIVSIVGGCCMIKPMILDWDKRFLKPIENVAGTGKRRTGSYAEGLAPVEDLDLFGDSGAGYTLQPSAYEMNMTARASQQRMTQQRMAQQAEMQRQRQWQEQQRREALHRQQVGYGTQYRGQGRSMVDNYSSQRNGYAQQQRPVVRYDQYGRPIANGNGRAQQNSRYSEQNNVRY